MSGLDLAPAERFAEMALACVHRPYPNKIQHVLASAADARPPPELTPAFYGAFDWHSAVHNHWSLLRLLRLYPQASFATRAERALDQSLVADKIAGEIEYASAKGREGFELPYGLAWLLCLGHELREWKDPRSARWHAALEPLERLAAERIEAWAARLPHPVRSGEHTQSAFGFALYLDWARIAGRSEARARVEARVRELHAGDRDGPLHLEPSGYDFLSPCLGEADLMRRVLDERTFARWLTQFLPSIPEADNEAWLRPAVCPDPHDGKLAHLDGLNLSRAWMLAGIAGGLPAEDARRAALLGASARHHAEGVAAVTGEHYEGSHWQATFAVYLLTGR